MPWLLFVFGLSAHAQSGDRYWIDRPWEFRYILKVSDPDAFRIDRKIGLEKLENDKPNVERLVEAIVPSIKTYVIPNEYSEADDKVATLLMTFNEQGELTSSYEWPHKLFGHLNRLERLVLAPGSRPDDLQFRLGDWFTGNTADDSPYVPAICDDLNDRQRYQSGFKANYVVGAFGCREWGYYLMSPNYPYIDVTSYQFGQDFTKKPDKKGNYPLRRISVIRPTIGWGRFDVPPKPVIGRHGTNWICLYECPNGDAPGIIPDIKAWAEKNGWPEPKPPKKMPLFPDIQHKPGERVD